MFFKSELWKYKFKYQASITNAVLDSERQFLFHVVLPQELRVDERNGNGYESQQRTSSLLHTNCSEK